jgi:hypothetical protein
MGFGDMSMNFKKFMPTKFEQKVRKMEEEDCFEDNDSFFNKFIDLFDTVNKLGAPIKWFK